MQFRAVIATGVTLAFLLPLHIFVLRAEEARRGGTLIVSSHVAPQTFNPLIAVGTATREVIQLLNADLIHINAYTHTTEPALAASWSVSKDGRRYTMQLRRDVRFSDGEPFDADDVVFSFQSYLDPRLQAPQRDLFIIAGKPISVTKVDRYTVSFSMAEPYAAAERLFDGVAMLPRHLLSSRLAQGTLRSAWGVVTDPSQIVGLGPFRLKEFLPGQRIVFERNPFYWRHDEQGGQLPYLDQLVSIIVSNADAEVLRFQQGETDIVSKLDTANFELLRQETGKPPYHALDAGPGLEYDFLFFNQNALASPPSPHFAAKQEWFANKAFRQAVSSAIDRSAIVRIAFFGRADPLATEVTPANKRWLNTSIVPPARSLAQARRLLSTAAFAWNRDGMLIDRNALPVRFSLLVNAGKQQLVQMATLIQQDLREIGITVDIDALEAHTYMDRILSNFKYETAILALADGDVDPNTEINVLTSKGSLHVWQLHSQTPVEPWQNELDQLMKAQLIIANYQERKRLFDRVQDLMWENMPMICLVSPHVLVAAQNKVGNFRPAVLGSYTLWNAERLYLAR